MIRALIAAPFLLVFVLFALSNKTMTTFLLWPTDYAVTFPLSLAVFVAMGVAFVAGALVTWVSAVAARSRARRAEHRVRLLEAQVDELKARISIARSSAAAAARSGALVPVGR